MYAACPATGHPYRAADSRFGRFSEGGPVKYFYADFGRLTQLQSDLVLV